MTTIDHAPSFNEQGVRYDDVNVGDELPDARRSR